MKQMRMFCLLAILSLSIGAFAQGGAKPAAPAASPAPQAQASPAPPPTFASVVDRQVSQYEKNVVEAAEAMPADKFDLLLPASRFPGPRTAMSAPLPIGEAHSHGKLSFLDQRDRREDAGNIKGPNGPDELKTKDQIMQFLKDSFAVGHRAAKTLTAENALEDI